MSCRYKDKCRGYHNSCNENECCVALRTIIEDMNVYLEEDHQENTCMLDCRDAEIKQLKKENTNLKEKIKNSVQLPCKVGDTVYTNITHSGDYERAKDRPYMHKVVFIGVNGKEDFFNTVNTKTGIMFTFNFKNIGKTVFLTREEAEKALKEREHNA